MNDAFLLAVGAAGSLVLCHSERSMIIREAMIMQSRETCFSTNVKVCDVEASVDEMRMTLSRLSRAAAEFN